MQAKHNGATRFATAGLTQIVLAGYTLLALFPIALIIINSLKSRAGIFDDPLALPNSETFSLIGFEKVLHSSHFTLYFGNSLIVTITSLVLILLFGAMAAWALAEYRFKGSRILALFFCLRHHGADPPGHGVHPQADGQPATGEYADRAGAGVCGARLAASDHDPERIHAADS